VKIVNSKIYLKTLIIEWKEKIWKNGWILKKKKKKKSQNICSQVKGWNSRYNNRILYLFK